MSPSPISLTPIGVIWCIAVLSSFLVASLAGVVEPTAMTLGIILLCATFELVDSSLGMGYGTSLTPILLLLGFEPLQLVPTILVSELVSGFAAAFFHTEAGNLQLRRGSRHLRAAVVLSACSVIGVYAGVELAFGVSKRLLSGLISGVILAAGLYILLCAGRTVAYRSWKIFLLGLVASFNKALSGGGYGPLMTSGQVISGVEGRAAVGITSLAEAFTCLAAASLFILHGSVLEPGLLVPVLTGALLSVPLSAQIVRHLPERGFRHVVAWLTIALGLLSLSKVVLGSRLAARAARRRPARATRRPGGDADAPQPPGRRPLALVLIAPSAAARPRGSGTGSSDRASARARPFPTWKTPPAGREPSRSLRF